MDYYASYKNSKDPSLLRKELVSYALTYGVILFCSNSPFSRYGKRLCYILLPITVQLSSCLQLVHITEQN